MCFGDELCDPVNFFRVYYFTACKGFQNSLGFWIPRLGFRIPGTRFQSLSVELGPGVRIRQAKISRIHDSWRKNSLDSGISGLPQIGRIIKGWSYDFSRLICYHTQLLLPWQPFTYSLWFKRHNLKYDFITYKTVGSLFPKWPTIVFIQHCFILNVIFYKALATCSHLLSFNENFYWYL